MWLAWRIEIQRWVRLQRLRQRLLIQQFSSCCLHKCHIVIVYTINTWNKWSTNFDKRPHRKGRIVHGWGNVMWHRPALQFAVAVTLLCRYWVFLQHTTQQWLTMLHRGPNNPKNCPFPWGISTPSNTWFLRHTQVSPQTASWSVQLFCMVYERDQQICIDGHYRPRDPVCSNRPHLAVAAMRPRNYNTLQKPITARKDFTLSGYCVKLLLCNC